MVRSTRLIRHRSLLQQMHIKVGTALGSATVLLTLDSIVIVLIEYRLSIDSRPAPYHFSSLLGLIYLVAALTGFLAFIVTLGACFALCFKLSPVRLFLSGVIAGVVLVCLFIVSESFVKANPHGLGGVFVGLDILGLAAASTLFMLAAAIRLL